MAVNLSPVGGVAAQFFSNNGVPLAGGKLYTYLAGTTTPAATYTSSNGNTAWTNPIVLDAAGRVSGSGEIWLTDGLLYKFLLKDANDVLIATYDDISGINSNFVAFVNQQEIVTATAGQTVFNLGISYQPGTNSLSVFVDGVNQYGPGAQYSYVETDSNTVTFNSGLHVGAEVKFVTSQLQNASVGDASQVTYDPPFSGGVATSVEDKLAETVSVFDFMTPAQIASVRAGNLSENVTAAIQAAINYVSSRPTRGTVYFPAGKYYVATGVTVTTNGVWLRGEAMYSARIVGLPGNTADLVAFGPVTGLPSGVVDLGIVFENGNTTYNCLTLNNCNGTFLNRVWVNGGKRGFNLITGTDDCHLTDCVAEECIESNFYVTGCHGIKLLNCLSYASQINGLQMDTGPAVGVNHARPVQISNFVDTNSQNFGVVVDDYTDVSFENLSVVSAGSTDRPNGGVRLIDCERIVMSNVTVSHTEFVGIQINTSTSVSITNPMIDRVGDYPSVPSAAYYGILVDNSTASIVGGVVSDVAGYGVRFAANSDGKLIGTDIINPCQNGDATNGLVGLYVTDGTPHLVISGVTITGNSVAASIGFSVETTAVLRFSDNYITGFPTNYAQVSGFVPLHMSNNAGIVTENSGIATIPSGSTSVIVTHGMSIPLNDQDISLTFTNATTNDYGRWWVYNINATQFQINVASDPGASGLDVAWQVQVLRQ